MAKGKLIIVNTNDVKQVEELEEETKAELSKGRKTSSKAQSGTEGYAAQKYCLPTRYKRIASIHVSGLLLFVAFGPHSIDELDI